MEKIDKWVSSLSKEQKKIIAITIPIFLLIVCIAIAKNVDTNSSYRDKSAFDFGKTYLVWLITIVLITIAEFRIFKK